MSGRLLGWLLTALLLAGALLRLERGHQRQQASELLYQAEGISLSLLASGQAPRAYLQQNIRNLRRAAELDPLEVGIPLALGSQFLILGSHQAAMEAYRQALSVEPRPEVYLNLGKAHFLAGEMEEARESFRRATALDWHLEAEVPDLPGPPD